MKNKTPFSLIFYLWLGLFTCSQIFAQGNPILLTPPMGWNSWNIFKENINENQIKEIADAMVSTGMRDAGYIYLNLDDNWMASSRDENGKLRADPQRFPSGMKALGDYIHGKGLKFGIYGDRGIRTCHHYHANMNSRSGSYGLETQDAETFASWGVDYLKYDNCDPSPGSNMQEDYANMSNALKNTGRDIAFSICAWGFHNWMPNTGNLWRTTGDISDKWDLEPGFFRGIINIIDENEGLASHAKPGKWNDPDMLQIGNGGCTNEEYKTQMSMWSIMAAPLLAGNDIRKMSSAIKDILLNKEIIAVNQDSAGIQGRRIKSINGVEVWVKPLGDANSNRKAIALLNRNGNTANFTLDITDIGYSATEQISFRDLWDKKDLGYFSGEFSTSIPSHGTNVYITDREVFIHKVPGLIPATQFSVMSGIQIESDSLENSNIGYINDGDWAAYQISITTANSYILIAKLATNSSQNSFMDLTLSDGSQLGSFEIDHNKSQGWRDWYLDTIDISLP
ncbi:MAG: carbohydrate-binding protein [Fibrobacter sp.]|nr:carbohydrate-binding protein [Fibrobacter sp.]